MKGFAVALFLLMVFYGAAMAAVFGTQSVDPSGVTYILDYKTPDCVYRVNIPDRLAPNDPSKASIKTIILSDLSSFALLDFINQIQAFIKANPPSFVKRVREIVSGAAQSPQEVADGLEKDCLPALLAESLRRSSPMEASSLSELFSGWKNIEVTVGSGPVYNASVKVDLPVNALLVPPEWEVVYSTTAGFEISTPLILAGTHTFKVNFAANERNPVVTGQVSGFLKNGTRVKREFELPVNLKSETYSGGRVFARPVPQPYAGPAPLPEEPIPPKPPVFTGGLSGSPDFGPGVSPPIHDAEASRRLDEYKEGVLYGNKPEIIEGPGGVKEIVLPPPTILQKAVDYIRSFF